MTTIPPQPLPLPLLSANVPRALPVVTVADPPADLAQLAVGTAFEGKVTAVGNTTAVTIQTVYGALQIQMTLPIETGARLTLILQNLIPPLQLQIAAIDGKPPPATLRGVVPAPPTAAADVEAMPAAIGPGPGPAPAVDGAAAAGLRGLVGTSLTATVLCPPAPSTPLFYGPGQAATSLSEAPAATAAGSPAAPASASAPVAVTVAAAGRPPAPTTIAAPTTTATVLPSVAPEPVAAGLPPLAAGTRLTVRIVAIHPAPADPAAVPGGGPDPAMVPAAPAVATASAAPSVSAGPTAPSAAPLVGRTMTAVVTDTTASGQPVLRTPAGTVTLDTPVPVPRGAEVVLAVQSEPLLAGSTISPPPPRPVDLVQSSAWPALAEVYQTLQSLDPPAAHHMAATVLPQANTRLAADMLFFLSALRGGDVSGWLNADAVHVLRDQRPDLLGRLDGDFRQIATLARQPTADNWRVALVPFLAGPQFEQIRLYLRPYGGGQAGTDGTPQGIRFIVDVDLSRLGRLQLDGLVRDDRKRFDLIVRSEEPLTVAMQSDIRTIFEDANELAGVVGGLTFQAAPAHFVDIAAAGKAAEGPGLLA